MRKTQNFENLTFGEFFSSSPILAPILARKIKTLLWRSDSCWECFFEYFYEKNTNIKYFFTEKLIFGVAQLYLVIPWTEKFFPILSGFGRVWQIPIDRQVVPRKKYVEKCICGRW